MRPQPRHQHVDGGSELVSVLRLTPLLAAVWESEAVGGEKEYGNVYLDMSSYERLV